MSFRLIGGLFITAGFGILGLWLSSSEGSKVRDVKELYDFILFVYKRVSESMTPLCEICEEYGKARNYGFAKLLIFGRLLNPASKAATVKQNDNYCLFISFCHNID